MRSTNLSVLARWSSPMQRSAERVRRRSIPTPSLLHPYNCRNGVDRDRGAVQIVRQRAGQMDCLVLTGQPDKFYDIFEGTEQILSTA